MKHNIELPIESIQLLGTEIYFLEDDDCNVLARLECENANDRANEIVKRVNQHDQLKELLEYFMTADANSPEFDEKMSEALKLLED